MAITIKRINELPAGTPASTSPVMFGIGNDIFRINYGVLSGLINQGNIQDLSYPITVINTTIVLGGSFGINPLSGISLTINAGEIHFVRFDVIDENGILGTDTYILPLGEGVYNDLGAELTYDDLIRVDRKPVETAGTANTVTYTAADLNEINTASPALDFSDTDLIYFVELDGVLYRFVGTNGLYGTGELQMTMGDLSQVTTNTAISIDTAFSDTSTNPVENRIVSDLQHFTKVKTTNLTATEIKKLSYQKIICQASLTIDLDDTFEDTFNVIVQVDAGYTVTLNATSPATVDVSTLTEGVYFLSKKNGTDEFVAKEQGSGSLIRKDEGNGEGYFLSGQNRANHGNIGSNAVDLSYQSSQSSTTGATSAYSHAEGNGTTASGDGSHAEGINTEAIGDFCHAEGFESTASDEASHAEGLETIASGSASHAEGDNNFARANAEHSGGVYGTDYTPAGDDTDRLFNQGNGTNSSNRSDAFTIYKNGAVRFFREAIANITNTIKEGLLILDSSNNNRLTIHNGTEWKAYAYLDEVGSGGDQNVQPDWTQTDDTQDDYIKNKPINVVENPNVTTNLVIDPTLEPAHLYRLSANIDLTIDASNIGVLESYVTELRVTSDTGTETLTLLNSTDTKDVYGTFDPSAVNKIVISATKDDSGNVFLSYFINQPN